MRKGLLVGAGFSFDLGMPLANELTEDFLGLFNPKNARRLADVLANNDPFSAGRPINRDAIHRGIDLLLACKTNGGVNYEVFLAKLEGLGDIAGATQSDRDSYHYLFSFFYGLIHQLLTKYQLVSYREMYARNLPNFSQLENLLNATEETWVFTLNHDIYFECLAIDLGIPITYGDTDEIAFPLSNLHLSELVLLSSCPRQGLEIHGSGWIRNKKGVNLVRLHGGLCELEYRDSEMLCNPRLAQPTSMALISEFERIESMAFFVNGKPVSSGRDRIITGRDGDLDVIRRSVLTGGRKYSTTTTPKKGEEKLALLSAALGTIDELTVIGYGFRDRHVNYRVSNAMVMNEAMKIKIVDPVGPRCPEVLEQFDYGDRIRGGQCGAPHWMPFAKDQKWDSAQLERLRTNVALRANVRKKVLAEFPR